MNIVIINTKGGASKSTTAFQVACTYFLVKVQGVELFELDNQNRDSANFSKSLIKSDEKSVKQDSSSHKNLIIS